jgi:hypothetical protein
MNPPDYEVVCHPLETQDNQNNFTKGCYNPSQEKDDFKQSFRRVLETLTSAQIHWEIKQLQQHYKSTMTAAVKLSRLLRRNSNVKVYKSYTEKIAAATNIQLALMIASNHQGSQMKGEAIIFSSATYANSVLSIIQMVHTQEREANQNSIYRNNSDQSARFNSYGCHSI